MHWNFCTLGSLKAAVDSLIERYGEDTPIGTESEDHTSISDINLLHVVYIDDEGNITGTYKENGHPNSLSIEAIGIV
jgi:hypothetical protein